MARLYTTDENGNATALLGTPQYATDLPLNSSPTAPTTEAAINAKQDKITYHQETTTPDSGGVFNTGVAIDKVPLSCTSSNGYVSGFVYSGGYWHARIVNYAGSPVTTPVTVSTWYIDNPS